MKNFQTLFNKINKSSPGHLFNFVYSKLYSHIQRKSFKNLGHSFFISHDSKIKGQKFISIGNKFSAGEMLWIEAIDDYFGQKFSPKIEIGNNVSCSQNVHIAANASVFIEDGVLFGSRIHVTDHAHGNYRGIHQDSPEVPPLYRSLSAGLPVRIKANVWIGDGVVVLPGVTIGEGSVIGANSIVSNDIPPRVIAVGTPAVPIKRYCEHQKIWIPI